MIQDNSIKGLAEIRIPFLFRIAIKYKNFATSREFRGLLKMILVIFKQAVLTRFCERIQWLCSEALDY